jgi:hypothetical protein
MAWFEILVRFGNSVLISKLRFEEAGKVRLHFQRI